MNKKGSILIIATILQIVAAITSVGMYNGIYLAGKMQGIGEVRRTRLYYAASAGLSYARVIFANSPIPTSPIYVHATYPTLWGALGLTGTEDVVITYTGPVDGVYEVTSTAIF